MWKCNFFETLYVLQWHIVVKAGEIVPKDCRFVSCWRQPNFSLYIGDQKNLVKWREYFGSHLFAAKIPGTLAGIKIKMFRPIAVSNQLCYLEYLHEKTKFYETVFHSHIGPRWYFL